MANAGVRKSRYRRPVCPFCGYDDQVVRIFYGMPGPEVIQESRQGEVALGGCCIGPNSHNWYCRGCLQTFDIPRFEDSVQH
ncbi:MAG: hypothetical protein ACE14L_14310 [Terriglobales bacterium]